MAEETRQEFRYIIYAASLAVVPKDMPEGEVYEVLRKLRTTAPGSVITVGKIGKNEFVFCIPVEFRGAKHRNDNDFWDRCKEGLHIIHRTLGVEVDLEKLRPQLFQVSRS